MKKRIVIVDDHPIVREGFTKLINTESCFEVVGSAENAAAALEMINEIKPDVAMVDLSLKDSSGIELIKDLQNICPDVKVIVVSLHDEDLYA